MANYRVTTPKADLIRVEFLAQWDPENESAAMFREVLNLLDATERPVNLLIVAGNQRPAYTPDGLGAARSILTHDKIKQMIVVANDAELAISHMGARRGERGLPPIAMRAFDREEDALPFL